MKIKSIVRSLALGLALASAAIAPVACSGETGAAVVAPSEIVGADCDLFSPNAAGGVVDGVSPNQSQPTAVPVTS